MDGENPCYVGLPPERRVIRSYRLLQAHDSAIKQEEVAVWEEERRESRCSV